MKNRLIKLFIATIALVAFNALSNAQTTTNSQQFPAGFTGIEISDDFNVTLRSGETCSVTWTVDTVLKDYIEVYVKGQVLHIEFNRKGMSSELKKAYRGKNAPKPTLNASITTNELKSLSVADNAVVSAYNEDFYGDTFSLKATGTSKVNELGVATGSGTIDVSGKAEVKMTVYSNKDITLKTANNAVLGVEQECTTLSMSAAGSSTITVTGNVTKASDVNNSATIILRGSCPSLSVKSSGSSAVTDATGFQVKDASVSMSGSGKVNLNPSDNLKLEIKDGTVTYSNDPKIEIVSIVKASVTRE